MSRAVTILGAGLAGSEAALWLANSGVQVTLFEQKPRQFSPAHKSEGLAELVCSNSLKAMRTESAAGLLKEEMRLLGSHLLPVADACSVPAGGALAVDRDAFSAGVTALVEAHPGIDLVRQPVRAVPRQGLVIVATGPLTAGPLADDIAALAGQGQLFFYDAAAPIITAESVDRGKVFAAARYGRGEADYLNCAFDKAGYEAFYQELIKAEAAELHSFDGTAIPAGGPGCPPQGTQAGQNNGAPAARHVPVYEGCMPVEVMARRGPDTLRYGPLRPVGLVDPATGHRPWACVQLRQENAEKSLYNLVGFQTNLKFSEQCRVFRLIPGLENAEFARYGVMHRNTFLDSPKVLNSDQSLKTAENVLFAGQMTGFEGYMESAASGLLAARAALARLQSTGYTPPPPSTMCGALAAYITAPNKDFQPMGANMGLLPPLQEQCRDKRVRYGQMAARALASLQQWLGLQAFSCQHNQPPG